MCRKSNKKPEKSVYISLNNNKKTAKIASLKTKCNKEAGRNRIRIILSIAVVVVVVVSFGFFAARFGTVGSCLAGGCILSTGVYVYVCVCTIRSRNRK